ncbi:MAG: cache domain-containing protein [Schwartzia sp.]|nr:cache domain-containing protein [Schwartzia sp. (in: firmicutes)]
MNMKKMGIQRRILLLLLSAGLVTFFVLSAASFISLYQGRSDALETGGAMGKTVEGFAEDFAVRQAKKRISDVAEQKAENVEHVVEGILADADNMVKTMTGILSDSADYSPIMLMTPTESQIPGNTAYIYLRRGLSERIFSDPALMREIGTASNIGKCLEFTSRRYTSDTSCYIASDNGYLIWVDGLSKGQTMAEFPEVYLKQEFDAVKRPWYIAAKKEGHPIVSEVYISVEGDSEITCAAPYYENGKFAGVAGISTPLHALHEIIQKKSGRGKCQLRT